MLRKFCLHTLLVIATAALGLGGVQQDANTHGPLRVGLAGSQPFVVQEQSGYSGIAVEIWQAIATDAGWHYRFVPYNSVPLALQALQHGDLDVVAGPVSITADRLAISRFSQPYFQSSLSILSRSERPSLWRRIAPFFSPSFFVAVCVLLFILAIVGTLIWLAERGPSNDQFPIGPASGIANGVWLAIVTMTTVGYGDRAPKTFWGRAITGAWMLISIITATSLVAGIASTLTLSGMQSSAIETADQLKGHRVAVIAGSPGAELASSYHAKIVPVDSIEAGRKLVEKAGADALVFDRPQLLYLVRINHDSKLSISKAVYAPEGYGFAFPLTSQLLHSANLSLLRLQEDGRIDRIVREWLGDQARPSF